VFEVKREKGGVDMKTQPVERCPVCDKVLYFTKWVKYSSLGDFFQNLITVRGTKESFCPEHFHLAKK